MNIDERIERLTLRHEALSQSVEILRDTVHESATKVDRLTDLMAQLLGAMKTLAETASNHERRITGLEGV